MAIPMQLRLFWSAYERFAGPSIMQLPPEQMRAASDRRRRMLQLPGAAVIVGRVHPGVLIVTKTAEGQDGVPLPVRVYRPADSVGEQLPLVVAFHGGGFVSGDARQSDWWCSSLSHDARVVVASVEYRLAPEHPYPVPPEDCYAATVWAVAHAADLGADGARVAVMGDSAGGNLAAVVALMARDRGGPPLALQVLIYPAVDHAGSYASEEENAFAPVLGKADLGVSAVYCPGHEEEPYASPIRADHHGLPAALIQTAQHDPLRDHGSAYAAALRAAGGSVQLNNYVDAVHGYAALPGLVPVARQALADAVSVVRATFAEPADFREQKGLE